MFFSLGDYVVRIQRAWRSYYNRKEYVSMQVYSDKLQNLFDFYLLLSIITQMEIAKLYKDAGKSRRRDSIFRPYQGDYLDSLAGVNSDNVVEIK